MDAREDGRRAEPQRLRQVVRRQARVLQRDREAGDRLCGQRAAPGLGRGRYDLGLEGRRRAAHDLETGPCSRLHGARRLHDHVKRRDPLREPVRGAVELIAKARALGIPIVAVDTPTAVDLSSGDPSDPVVQADLTVTFHRPKTGLLTRRGAALAGRVLVAPIGIPREADPG